jgi:replicative DNA helicase
MSANFETQPMPHFPLSEKYVISCMFTEPGRFISRAAADGVDHEAFHLPQHRVMLEHIKEDFQKCGNLDLSIFVQDRNADGTLDTMGGASTVYDIASYAVDGGGQWTPHVQRLKEMKGQRLARAATVGLSEASDTEEAIHVLQNALDRVKAAVSGPKRSLSGREAVNEFSDKLHADHEAGDLPGKKTGIQQLDEISGGMKPGEFWVIGARPSEGKTVLMLQIASEFIERGDPVAIFSLELMNHEIIGRLISKMGRVDFGSITQPRQLTKHDLEKIETTAKKISAAPLWIDASAGQNVDTITAEATRIRDTHGSLALIVVDYLQLIRGPRSRDDLREQEVARTSGGLKQLAKALGCPVLSASQLNDDGRVRESRAITHDADSVLIIAEDGVKVLKMRNGQRNATLPLHLDGRLQRFTETRQ